MTRPGSATRAGHEHTDTKGPGAIPGLFHWCQAACGMRAITLISKSKPASQLTPTAVQFG